MSRESSEELAALMAQCESALGEYSSRTGAPMFGEVANNPTSKYTIQSKKLQQKRAALEALRESKLVL
jgi:hypothetical protein|tara:strand:- start:1815 stop:2018 length:204 start_codon:yes stop_codon:yes gene_type:complete